MTTTTELPRPTRNPIFIEDEDTITTTSVAPSKRSRAPRVAGYALTGQPLHSIVLRPAETVDPAAREKRFWRVSNQVPMSFGYVLHIEVSIEQLGLPSDAIASESPWPSLWTQPHASYRSRPGVLFITHQRPTIFEQSLVISTASLPWWKPQIVLNKHRFGKRHD